MQAFPSLAVDGIIDIQASNQAQQRGPHGLFRFFGKLPPDVTGAVLDLAFDHIGVASPVVDVMCGSGTTLVEAAHRGVAAFGFDVNPVATLYASCKARAIDLGTYLDSLASLASPGSPTRGEITEVFSRTANAPHWFEDEAQASIARLRLQLDKIPPSRERNLLLAVLLSCLRKCSNASPRTGRLFYSPDSAAKDCLAEYVNAARQAMWRAPTKDLPILVAQADAKRLPLPDSFTKLAFVHPPYFGLYRYSADVLRFELEIGGWSRREIASHEIREGWKSGDAGNLEAYLADMGQVFRELHRITAGGGLVALVASNSTLGDQQLPVIEGLLFAAAQGGLHARFHYLRRAHHGTAAYHRSKRSDKVIRQDHVLLLEKA